MPTVKVKAKSNKAKNRLSNLMNNNSSCIVERKEGNRWFLASENQKYFFWVTIPNDENWIIL